MAVKMKRSCAHPLCAQLTEGTYCDQHKQQTVRQYNRQRGTAAERGYDGKWRKYRLSFLRAHPLCVECERDMRLTPATVVDHIKPHKGDMGLFWDKSNHQALCKQCHDRKTAKEDGGFGR